jgi:transcriptional regulator with XRE-family HTH domain
MSAVARIGRTIERLRTERGLSQQELAKRARVTQAYVSELERGLRSNPSIAVITRLAQALGLSLIAFLETSGGAETLRRAQNQRPGPRPDPYDERPRR